MSLWLILLASAPSVVYAQDNALQLYKDATAREAELRREIDTRKAGAPALPLLRHARILVGTYEDIARLFPRSAYSDNALWQGGMLAADSFWEFGEAADRSTALRMLKAVGARYPSSSLVEQATAQVARLSAAQPAQAATAVQAAAPASSPSTLKSIRREILPGALRVTLELEKEVPFYDERLEGPSRVFVDLQNTQSVEALKDATLTYADDVVRQIRVGRQLGVRTRVVLDLEGAGRHSVYALYDPFRIVIDVERPGATRDTKTVLATKDTKSTREGQDTKGPTTKGTKDAKAPTTLATRSVPASTDTPAQIAPTNISAIAPTSVSAIAPTSVSAIAPASVSAIAPTSVSAIAPTSVSAIAPTSVSAIAPTSVSAIAPASVSAIAPAGVSAIAPKDSAPIAPKRNSDGTLSLSRQLGLGISRIVIDPGHGGHDPGAQARGLDEADLVLDVALRLEKLLLKQPGVEVVMTRRTDEFIALEERTAIANREQADLFLSIHANASADVRARGIETYFLNFAPNPQAEAIAARENAGSGRTMGSLPDIVKAIALNNKIDESRDFASLVQGAMVERLRTARRAPKNLGVKQAPFVVLIGATMPSVLAEISFVTNKQEQAWLKTGAYRQQLAEALLNGITRYQKSLTGTQVAATR